MLHTYLSCATGSVWVIGRGGRPRFLRFFLLSRTRARSEKRAREREERPRKKRKHRARNSASSSLRRIILDTQFQSLNQLGRGKSKSWVKCIHLQAAGPCCMSLLHVLADGQAACQSCMSMLHVNAASPFCMYLHVCTTYTCFMAMLNVHAACSCQCCISLLHFHAICPCSMPMSKLHVLSYPISLVLAAQPGSPVLAVLSW